MPAVVFVTAFLDLGEDRSKDKSVETCFHHFNSLAQTGASIHLYLSPCYQKAYDTICRHHPNVLVEFVELSQLETYKEIQDLDAQLPAIRTPHHDTRAFLTLMNAKAELLYRATNDAKAYGWFATHFAWVDFSIFHVFKTPKKTADYLRMLSGTRFRDNCMLAPGCWSQPAATDTLFQKVNWRFCGGFLLASVERIIELNTLYRNHFRTIVSERGLTWEVNMMAYFEHAHGWRPDWFQADHNDSIVRVPPHHIQVVGSLTTIPSRVNHCIAAINSLLSQVDHIYLSVCDKYKRFDERWETPGIFFEEPYISKVTVVISEDYGPATKYLGAATLIPPNTWMFICDDDQVYEENLINQMRLALETQAVYQNHCECIREKTSGGLIHGYVGLLMNSTDLVGLKRFPLPDMARFVDDQWVSIYCFKQGIPVLASGVEEYRKIFAVLDGWHEQIGPDSLAGLNNRGDMVKAIGEFFGVAFLKGTVISIG